MPNKYGAVKTKVDGITFDSGIEAARYQQLKLLMYAGEIWGLDTHPTYCLLPAETGTDGVIDAIHFKPDFRYKETGPDGETWLVIEDVKGGEATQTEAFKLKWNLLRRLLKRTPRVRFAIVTKDDM